MHTAEHTNILCITYCCPRPYCQRTHTSLVGRAGVRIGAAPASEAVAGCRGLSSGSWSGAENCGVGATTF